MKRMRNFIEKRGIWILILGFGFIYSFWSVTRHNRFQTDAVDLGIFDQPLWRYSRLETPLSTIKFNTYPGEHILGDHFHPLIIPLAFLYRLWDDVRFLLIAQAILAVLSVIPLYLFAKEKVGPVFALSLSFAYLGFVGFQTAIDYDFHEVTAGVGLVSAAVYFLLKKRWRVFYFLMGLSFLLKEDIPLLFAGLGLMAIFELREVKRGLIIFFISLSLYFLLVGQIIPIFKRDRFAYEEFDPRLGETTVDLLQKTVTDPLLVARVFFLPPVKYKTMLNLIGSFAFLPFLSPFSFLPILPNFLSRFLTGLGQRWLIRYQYNIVLTPLLAFGAILGVLRLIRFCSRRFGPRFRRPLLFFFSFLLVLAPAVQSLRTNAPWTRILNPHSYSFNPRFALNQELLKLIPKDPRVSVMAQSTFVPHLTHRYEIYRYEDWVLSKKKPQYVIMSADEGSDPPWGREVKLEKIANLAKSPDYEILFYDGVRLLMRRRS